MLNFDLLVSTVETELFNEFYEIIVYESGLFESIPKGTAISPAEGKVVLSRIPLDRLTWEDIAFLYEVDTSKEDFIKDLDLYDIVDDYLRYYEPKPGVDYFDNIDYFHDIDYFYDI